MTKQEQDIALGEIGLKLKSLFPDFFGSVQFNMHPQKRTVNINLEEESILSVTVREARLIEPNRSL